MTHSAAVRISALLAMLGVALGAFGAHGLKGVLAQTENGAEVWRTAVLYHLIHALAMYAVALTRQRLTAWWLMGGGVLLFSGSLYLLSTLHWKWLGPVTPAGGLLFIGGWLVLTLQKPRGL